MYGDTGTFLVFGCGRLPTWGMEVVYRYSVGDSMQDLRGIVLHHADTDYHEVKETPGEIDCGKRRRKQTAPRRLKLMRFYAKTRKSYSVMQNNSRRTGYGPSVNRMILADRRKLPVGKSCSHLRIPNKPLSSMPGKTRSTRYSRSREATDSARQPLEPSSPYLSCSGNGRGVMRKSHSFTGNLVMSCISVRVGKRISRSPLFPLSKRGGPNQDP